ncbi:MAG: LysM peptidoglycan-binding domain-containing protein [Verrucomicrobia bacterium]|nr:LysM peptidoglycan-binding domain-containing protein [Verrucomicrobiota bacterium]
MKPYRTAAIVFAALAAFLAACETTGYTQRRGPTEDPAITNLRADMRLLEDRINRVVGDVQALQVNYDRLQQQVASVQQQLSAAAASGGVSPAVISQLDQRISAIDAARKRDNEIIVNQVTAEIQKLGGTAGGISRRASSPGPTPAARVPTGKRVVASPGAAGAGGTPATAAGGEQGYEHVVEKGQYLGTIAKAYGVTVDQIKKANNLKNDILHVGQKLFIPKQ